ncbi:MAG: hypothetical protein RLZZ42_628, partial [Bacteroidota bacterium]
MKNIFYFILLLNSFSCNSNKTDKKLPRIAIAGLAIESSTFSPALTHEPAFKAKVDSNIFKAYPFLSVDSTLRKNANWFPTLQAHALPGGTVT